MENSPITGSYTHTLEYIWFGGNNEFRTKTKCIYTNNIQSLDIKDIGLWNYDGSSTNQATTENSEVILCPVRLYRDHSKKNKYYVLCETYKYIDNKLEPLENNYRAKFKELENKYKNKLHDYKFWFGFEQEFFMFNLKDNEYLNCTNDLENIEQGQYYCNVEATNYHNNTNDNLNKIKKYTESIYNKCLDLKIGVTGWNLEVAPGQTEIQVFGEGIKACDDLIMLRFLCNTELEQYDIVPDFHPKPLGSNFNGSGLHTNISTVYTRNENGYEEIQKYLELFKNNHNTHMEEYGDYNHLRLTGEHETSSYDTFTYNVGSRASSVRIPTTTLLENKGYFEDRRPSSCANPYRVVNVIINTILEANS
jgi:glutamine synthetase